MLRTYFMDTLDRATTLKLIETVVILAVGLGLFFGLKGRVAVFAQRANLPRLALTPVRVGLRYALLILTIFLVMGRWGFQTETIVTVLGTVLGLVAIGFVAVWSVLSNLLCTFVLIIVKPFSIGDEVEVVAGGMKGKVVDMSFVFTTLEVGPGQTVMIPNNTFFQGPFRRTVGAVTLGLDQQLRTHYPEAQAAAQPAN